jgi:hypothetical protein
VRLKAADDYEPVDPAPARVGPTGPDWPGLASYNSEERVLVETGVPENEINKLFAGRTRCVRLRMVRFKTE